MYSKLLQCTARSVSKHKILAGCRIEFNRDFPAQLPESLNWFRPGCDLIVLVTGLDLHPPLDHVDTVLLHEVVGPGLGLDRPLVPVPVQMTGHPLPADSQRKTTDCLVSSSHSVIAHSLRATKSLTNLVGLEITVSVCLTAQCSLNTSHVPDRPAEDQPLSFGRHKLSHGRTVVLEVGIHVHPGLTKSRNLKLTVSCYRQVETFWRLTTAPNSCFQPAAGWLFLSATVVSSLLFV